MVFKQVIEKFIEAEMPRVEGVGRITCKSAKCMAYKLIGKKRVAKLKFFDDNKGNGNVRRKDENLRTWKEFWSINAKEKSNECVYDSLLGATYLEDIKTHKIKKYVWKFPTLPVRKDRKNAVSSVITYGINEDLFGDDPPPVGITHFIINLIIFLKKLTQILNHLFITSLNLSLSSLAFFILFLLGEKSITK